MMEDNQILELYFNREEQAIEETKRKYGKRLYMTARNVLYNNEDAEECVNDTLMKAWAVIPPSRPTLFGAFLAKISRNLAINKWEAKSAAKRGGGETPLVLEELEEVIPSGDSPEQAYEARQVTDEINSFLKNCDKVTRVVFVRRYFYGESIKDISKRYKMTESKVKSLLFRTRKKLRLHLEKEEVII